MMCAAVVSSPRPVMLARRSPRHPGARSPAMKGRTVRPWVVAGSAATAASVAPPTGPRGPQISPRLVTIHERKQLGRLDPAGGQRRRVPVEPGVIEESRRRGDRHARGGLTEERVLQVLADRTPARDALELGRTL